MSSPIRTAVRSGTHRAPAPRRLRGLQNRADGELSFIKTRCRTIAQILWLMRDHSSLRRSEMFVESIRLTPPLQRSGMFGRWSSYRSAFSLFTRYYKHLALRSEERKQEPERSDVNQHSKDPPGQHSNGILLPAFKSGTNDNPRQICSHFLLKSNRWSQWNHNSGRKFSSPSLLTTTHRLSRNVCGRL